MNRAPDTLDERAWEASHWQQLQELFHLAETAPSGERTRILREASDDAVLVDRVLALLSVSDQPEQKPQLESGEGVPPRIGPYALLQHLGTGGLGSVYLSERIVGGAVFQCALKVLSPHAAGPEFEARFQREQQILSALNHPFITRMLDAGISDSAQPYLVMEYVAGDDVVTHCDRHALTVRQRLVLFLQICEAMSYAHRNLVVHLDLKPSNILVTAEGSARLLDFGTSKLMQNDSVNTTTVMATPAYASPEQLRREPVTTACDVYALGAILSELLSGKRPFEDSSVAMLIDHALREEEPPVLTSGLTEQAAARRGLSLSRLRALLLDDLSIIVARCLRSRPQDRYASVDALSEDVKRYLDGLPIKARRPTPLYTTRKFIHRHLSAVLLTACAALVVFTSLGYAAWKQHQALAAARRAVQMQQFLANLFTLANTHYTGKPAATVPEFLRLGTVVLPEMIHDPADRLTARLSLAESMLHNASYADARPELEKVARDARTEKLPAVEAEAEAEASIAAYRLGDLASGLALSKHAMQLINAASTVELRLLVEEAYSMQRYEQGRLSDDDVQSFRRTVAQARREHTEPHLLAGGMLALAEAESRRADLNDQMKLAQDALTIYQAEPWAVCDLADAAGTLGFLRQQTNDLQGSADMFRTSYGGFQKCQGPDARDTLEAGGYLGLAMVPLKQTRAAIPLLENVIPRLEAVAGSDNMQLRGPLLALARSYVAEKRFVDAEQTAAKLCHLVDGKINPKTSQMGAYQTVWARALAGQGRYREALAHAEAAVQAYDGENSPLPAARDNAALTRALVTDLRQKAGR